MILKVKAKNNDMKSKELDIVEILKDCPKGTKLYSIVHGECEYDGMESGEEYPIRILFTNRFGGVNDVVFTEDGRFEKGCGECILFPSKDNRDWSTFQVRQNFKQGDIVTRVHDGKSTILLMGDTDWSSPYNDVKYICLLNLSNDRFHVSEFIIDYWCTIKDFYEQDGYSLATDEEKKQLLDAIDKHGYVWDSEKYELRKKDEKPNFKKGDFVIRVSDKDEPYILLMDDTDWSSPKNEVNYICYVDLYNGNFKVSKSHDYWCGVDDFYNEGGYRLATDDEKKKLLDAIDKHGYVWDEEKLELRKKEHEFKPFDRVLVRDEYDTQWFATLFSHIDESPHGYKYGCCDGGYWKHCIPYEGNEHLLGTCDSPDEKGGKQ